MKTEYKNLITVYTQWNPIIAHENYFCVVHFNKGNCAQLINAYTHTHTVTRTRTACFGSTQSQWMREMCVQSLYLWLEYLFLLCTIKCSATAKSISIKSEQARNARPSLNTWHTDVFNSYFCSKRTKLILFVLFPFVLFSQIVLCIPHWSYSWGFFPVKSVLFSNEFKISESRIRFQSTRMRNKRACGCCQKNKRNPETNDFPQRAD